MNALDPMVLKGLREFTSRPRLRAAILRFMSDTLTEHEVETLQVSDRCLPPAACHLLPAVLLCSHPPCAARNACDGGWACLIRSSSILLCCVHTHQKTFALMDEDKSGTVTVQELTKAMLALPEHSSVGQKEIENIMKLVDQDQNGSICMWRGVGVRGVWVCLGLTSILSVCCTTAYDELLLSYVHKKLTAKEERLWAGA